MKNLAVVFSAVLFISTAESLFGQVGSTLGSSFPPEIWNSAGRKMGGVSAALADAVPQLLGNPANLAALDRRHVFLTLNNARKDFTFESFPTGGRKEVSWTRGFNLGYSAASVPFQLFKRRWVAAVSYNGRQWGEFDERYVNAEAGVLDFVGKRTGHVESISSAVGVAVFRKLRTGVSWTKWLGRYEWNYEAQGNGTDDYAGNSWQIGIAGELGRFSLGTSVYLPRRVMTSRSATTYWPDGESVRAIQNSNGAIAIGLGYRPWSRWIFGLGYAFKRSGEVEIVSPSGSMLKREYEGASIFSGAIEYLLTRGRFHVPVYVGYVAAELPEGLAYFPVFPTAESAEDQFRNELVFGAAIKSNPVALHLDARWTLNSCHYMLVALTPPYS